MKRRGILCFNLSRYAVDGRRGSNRPLGVAVLGHRCDDCHCCTARASRSSASSLPGVGRLESFGLKWCGGIEDTPLGSTVVGNDSKVADGGGSTFPTSTVLDGLTRDSLAPRMGSQASLFSPQDPPQVQLLRVAANWCLRHQLQVLGFDLKRAEIRALWPPIYRGFSLILKRI
jgi:hypothetical protein